MVALNNESLNRDPLKIWLQAWTSHWGSCSPPGHHMIWGAPEKLLTGVDNYTNHRGKKAKHTVTQQMKTLCKFQFYIG